MSILRRIRWINMTVRTKIVTVILVAALAPFTSVAYLVFRDFPQAIERSAVSNLEAVAVLQTARVGDWVALHRRRTEVISGREQLLNALAAYRAVPGRDTEEVLDKLMDSYSQSMADTDAVRIIGLDGVIVASTDRTSVGTRVAADLFLQKSRSAVTVSDVIKGPNGASSIRYAGPVKLDGLAAGTLELVVRGKQLELILSDYAGLGTTGETFLVQNSDDGKAYIATPLRFDHNAGSNQQIAMTAVDPAFQAIQGNNRTFTAGMAGYRGLPVLAVTRHIQGAPWGLVTQVDSAEALNAARGLASQSLLVLGFVLIFVVFLGGVLSQFATEPIETLSAAVARIQGGDFNATAEVYTRDEIGALAGAFNAMTGKLKLSYQALESKVAERTAELEEANRRLQEFDERLKASDKHLQEVNVRLQVANEQLQGQLATRLQDAPASRRKKAAKK